MANKENKVTKPIPMDPNQIKKIHDVMADHLKTEGKPISFAEATRQVLDIGLQFLALAQKAEKAGVLNGQHHQRTV